MRQLVMSYISGQKETAKQLEKASWNRYHLSDAFTWSLKSEEALDKADKIQGKEGDFWRDIAEQYKIASNYKKKAAEVHYLCGKNVESFWNWAGTSAYA